MKVTDRTIAKEFGMSVQTLHNWKNGTEAQKKRYNALKLSLEQDVRVSWAVTMTNGKEHLIDNAVISTFALDHKELIQSVKII